MIEPTVFDFLNLGARNVLLLGYKGPDPALRLSPRDIDRLKNAVQRLEHLPLRLDICWYPHFPDLPHLFARPDCGAGDEFLVITPDQAVQPCSFHHERVPFETIEDLKAIYLDLRTRKPATSTPGCTRTLFPLTVAAPSRPNARFFVWQAYGSNNSGDWTIVGRFRTPDGAKKAAQSLRELSRAHEAYLASAAGQQWLNDNGYYGGIPSPPLRQFGEAHGFDWSAKKEGLWWEEDGCGAPVLTAGAVGDAVVVYHRYCMGLPETPFRRFFAAVGATEFGYWKYDRPQVIATARGNNADAIQALKRHLDRVAAAKYPSDVKDLPPWGEIARDPRIESDEDRSTRLDRGPQRLEVFADSIRITLSFANTFAGALALEAWLRATGFEEIDLQLQADFTTIGATGVAPREAKTGLFGDTRPMATRLDEMTPEQVVKTAFDHCSTTTLSMHALARIAAPVRAALCHAEWLSCRATSDATVVASQIIQSIGPPAAAWARELWTWLALTGREIYGIVLHALFAALPAEEAMALSEAWVNQATDAKTKKDRLSLLQSFRNRSSST